MKISNREIIIAAIAILVLLGIGYFINTNSDDKKQDSAQEDTLDLDDSGSTDSNSDENKDEEVKEAQGVLSTDPKSAAEVTVATAPKNIVIKFDKEIAAGSEIMVVSDKNVDVVTAGNKITADLKQLSAPVNITVAGTYSVSYKIAWKDGTKSDGSYKFTVK